MSSRRLSAVASVAIFFAMDTSAKLSYPSSAAFSWRSVKMRSISGALSPSFFGSDASVGVDANCSKNCDARARYARYTFSRSALFSACDRTAMYEGASKVNIHGPFSAVAFSCLPRVLAVCAACSSA